LAAHEWAFQIPSKEKNKQKESGGRNNKKMKKKNCEISILFFRCTFLHFLLSLAFSS
jgi:hypothetical protein